MIVSDGIDRLQKANQLRRKKLIAIDNLCWKYSNTLSDQVWTSKISSTPESRTLAWDILSLQCESNKYRHAISKRVAY